MTNEEFVEQTYSGPIKMTVVTCRMLNDGLPINEIVRRIRIAERKRPEDIAYFGSSEHIARMAAEFWKRGVIP